MHGAAQPVRNHDVKATRQALTVALPGVDGLKGAIMMRGVRIEWLVVLALALAPLARQRRRWRGRGYRAGLRLRHRSIR